MHVLPSTLDTNVNNPTMFPTYGGKKKTYGGKKKRTIKRKGITNRKKTTKKYKLNNNNKYCARICVSKRNISMGYTIDKQKLQ